MYRSMYRVEFVQVAAAWVARKIAGLFHRQRRTR
jgi:hypothetical protein